MKPITYKRYRSYRLPQRNQGLEINPEPPSDIQSDYSSNIAEGVMVEGRISAEESPGGIDSTNPLKSSFQAANRHTVELEDALLHWQELATKTQKDLKTITKERDLLIREIDESAAVTGNLRKKYYQLEFEWQRSLLELEDLRNQLSNTQRAELETAVADRKRKIANLETKLTEIRELNSWYKANLETSRRHLEQSRLIASRQEAYITQLHLTIEKNELIADQISSQQKNQEQVISKLKTELPEKVEALETELNRLREIVRQKTSQLEAYQDEIELHLQQMEAQGKRLAEAQSTLIERELELQVVQEKVRRQTEFIGRIKKATSQRIQELEAKLKEQNQLSD